MSLSQEIISHLQSGSQQLGKDGKDGKTYLVKLSKSFSKHSLKKNSEIAVKTFKPKKSTAKIQKEAQYQTLAAEEGISPQIYSVNLDERFIAMDKLPNLVVEEYRGKELPERLQYQICALMARLDSIKVLHNDSNALNVMTDKDGRPYMIDYGFAKKITPKILKKHGEHPNVAVTLWGLTKGFRAYKIGTGIMKECYDTYYAGEDISNWINVGEQELASEIPKRAKKRRRR
jgi:tRNA A-37 threonylcarbamoyl transferase component Bud32